VVVTNLELVDISLPEGAVWQINREIEFTFSEPIDFTTVSSNTISIQTSNQVPATGVFRQRDANTVVFQPNCPTRQDLSDAGLQPGAVTYNLSVKGRDTSGQTIRSAAGGALGVTQRRRFSTPASSQASLAFLDVRPDGPPEPVLRSDEPDDDEQVGTYLEIGGDPDDRVYFERDPVTQELVLTIDGVVDPDFAVPLNLYSEPSSSVVVVIEFNQPVNPSSNNIAASRMRLEYLDSGGGWQAIDTLITLEANCTETGARVRLEPIGVLPAASRFRAVILPGFQDIVGQTNTETLVTFAVAPTRSVDFPSLPPPEIISDELKEDFDFGGSSPLSFEDTEALFDSPSAEWGDGKLTAAFSFDGTGGPGGDFDWIVKEGEIFFFDTTNTPIVGGPNGVPTATLNAVNGVVDVNDLIIEEGGEIRVQGPNPMRINATGDVRIDGKLDISGFNAKDVATLGTGNQIEIGGAGVGASGRGGHANTNTTTSTPRGGKGQGPYRQANTGGNGGEMGYNSAQGPNAVDNRRPGGGGGGRFAKDRTGLSTPAGVSTAATAGGPGNPLAKGAETGIRAAGGAPGLGPFQDGSDENDFFGVRPVVEGVSLVGLIRGELPSVWAGYGGGGGGNAGNTTTFPTTGWTCCALTGPSSDEKGGGGGGGGGGLHVKALGRIVFGFTGRILSNGARGGTGENTYFLDHIGGTGGGGSGGHIILESATLVDFTDGGLNTNTDVLKDWVQACGPVVKTGPVTYVNTCCRAQSNGGAGSAGVIQIHVPAATLAPGTDPGTTDIVIPSLAAAALDSLDQITSPPAIVMIPTFGARSKVRSEWISIGGADQKPGGAGLVSFLFEGVDTTPGPNPDEPGPDEGKILVDGSNVIDRTALVAENLEGSDTALILPGGGGLTFLLRGSSLQAIRTGTTGTSKISNDIYLRTPALLEDCTLRLGAENAPLIAQDFTVVSAVYDEGAVAPDDETLTLTVSSNSLETLQSFFDTNAPDQTLRYELLPRFFSVVTNGVEGTLPENAFVRVLFQAARDNGIGAPDEANPLVPWTGDISKFNDLDPGELQFFRFEVEFDLDSQAQGVTADTVPVSLDFLRVPFFF